MGTKTAHITVEQAYYNCSISQRHAQAQLCDTKATRYK